jgi:hypothetical protein
MSTELRFLPYQPQNPAAPTLAEIQSATLVLDGAFIDVNAVFKQASEAMEEAAESVHRILTNYETRFTITREYPAGRREHRQVATRWARLFRRPALIHNGRKSR